MKIGLVGYQGSGKSSLFEWLTGVASDPSRSHTAQAAMATVPDDRVQPLCDIYHPKKVTLASLELVDTPGLSRKHEGNAARLGLIREADCLLFVVASFDGSDPITDLNSFREDLLFTDLEIMTGRVERLREEVKKPRPNRDEQVAELAAIEPLLAHLESGGSFDDLSLGDEQERAIRSFQLFMRKSRLAIINVADEQPDAAKFEQAAPEGLPAIAVPVGLELELARMDSDEREEFRREMGFKSFDRDGLLQSIMAASGQMLFFTAGEKEVRTWMTPVGTTAVEAAHGIHSDLARGFIRAETMTCDDLIRWGSEREVKAQNLVRQEPKDYVIQDGDILNIKFSV